MLVARNGQQRELTLRLIQEKDFFNAEFVRRKLGITLDPLTPQLLVRMGLSDGLMISNVERGGPGSQAEVERGMILMGLNSERPTSVVEAAKALFGKKRGEPIELTLLVTERTALGYRPYVGKTTIKVR